MRKHLLFVALCAIAAGFMLGGPATADAAQKKKMTEYTTVYPNGTNHELTTLNYLYANHTSIIATAYCTHDGLVDFDRFGYITPGLATEWKISDDQLTYTFTLRKGVKWYTWNGKEYADLVAQDFVDAVKWTITKTNASANAKTIYSSLKNAREYFDGTLTDFSQVGVRALDAHTVQYTLKSPIPYFIKQVSFPAYFPMNGKFLAEKGKRFGTSKENMIYCGAYLLDEFEPQQRRVLIANPKYWGKDAITAESLTFIYNAEASALGAELFLRGEINDFILPGAIVEEWMNDPKKRAMIYPNNLTNMSYFMSFNFEPKYEAEYAPQDWATAVNDIDFRKSLFHGLDRMAAIITVEPFNPKRMLLNTFTRRGLAETGGVDYTMLKGLKAYSETESFNPEKALAHKKKAMESLKGKVAFPLKVVMPYNTTSVDNANRAQIIEQQMEKLLGKEYIDIVLVSYPSTGFNQNVRNPGKFSFMETRWGPDYADPHGMLDPVLKDASSKRFGRIHLAKDILDADGGNKYEKMVEAAHAEARDMKKRYELFADAETCLLDNALVVPFYTSGGGYRASYLDPFSGLTGQMGRFGAVKMKGVIVRDKPIGMDGFPAAEAAYLKERAERAKAAQ